METAIVWVAITFLAVCLLLVARSDWPRLQGIGRSVTAEVVGHRSQYHNNVRSYAPIYRFAAEGAEHEVIDQVYGGSEQPPVGTRIVLSYPVGRPDLARPPRPLLWLAVYAFLLFALGLMLAKAFGFLSD
ncbi:hypothetical protein ACFFF7_05175 [Novosphingobium aquiterrae]|uniref:DUF3592 domain-containing protein n=1 Tax=Novosphingobium aquiterrae TaxID=624388 RepID=A0ABV6PG27_9SPHN